MSEDRWWKVSVTSEDEDGHVTSYDIEHKGSWRRAIREALDDLPDVVEPVLEVTYAEVIVERRR